MTLECKFCAPGHEYVHEKYIHKIMQKFMHINLSHHDCDI